MAKDAKAEAVSTEDAELAPPRTRKKLIILIAAAVFLVVCVAGAAFFMMKGHARAESEDGDDAVEKTKLVKKGKETAPVYVALDAFTVNLVPENGDQFLQLMMSVEVVDGQVGERMKMYTPKLRNNVMMLLSGKKAAELITKDGKQALANEIRDLINDILDNGDRKSEDGPVKEVLFTSFIIQ